MWNKRVIFLSLLLAYSLMLAHSLIPHHHHETPDEAVHHHNQHNNEHDHSNDHNHSHDNGDKQDGHATHFVHQPGINYYVPSTNDLLSFKPDILLDIFYIVEDEILPGLHNSALEITWHPESPPPLLTNTSSTLFRRGPPVII